MFVNHHSTLCVCMASCVLFECVSHTVAEGVHLVVIIPDHLVQDNHVPASSNGSLIYVVCT